MSAGAATDLTGLAPAPARGARPWVQTLKRAWALGRTKVGVALTLAIVGLAIVGPLLSSRSPQQIVGAPFAGPSAGHPLGTDYLGHDVWARVLFGGVSVVGLSLAAAVVGVLSGLAVGLVAGYWRGRLDELLMGVCDVVLAFPQIVLVLVCVAMVGPNLVLIVALVALSHMPRVARLVRSVTLEIAEREFVQSVQLMGVPRWRILAQEILPNLTTPILIEFGLRLTWSIGTIAALSFLGYGIQPPAADWGLMINENRSGLTTQVWAVAAPALCIFAFTVGTNLITEGIARAVGRNDGGSGA